MDDKNRADQLKDMGYELTDNGLVKPTRPQGTQGLGIMETPEGEKESNFETPEQKQIKNIVIALRGIEKELHELNRNLRSRK